MQLILDLDCLKLGRGDGSPWCMSYTVHNLDNEELCYGVYEDGQVNGEVAA